ncbi:MAG: DUF58 domain-containing protein [Candidatus Marinimicrobia bacterium]|jgi:uncharacterized protein (DUF58 family)|nr:DUF58 domain-containing protein [Candidatus Neomarinimicrobiota bacterium]MBT3633140.1 DUF58 domain-containing protein [Candidatus Neomarinimicrobiota bacterium]MBT3682259.1 DUF58 domain-containing protein [Candidatus Neomarinimicrobiota bacterium]MBT3758740.1 DUF58 domain-containing protein [Candidatus Neomarinimicrobiota bacterium]MBT3895386.1 DUF58 domain-containing protein [Candidatus Neomarinimicrobiota bacterium]
MDKAKYLTPSIISKLDNLSLKARLVVEGFIVGQHKSPYHGFSVEFSQHRAYDQGDEIRHIDWKLFGKTDRYYIKQYEEETNLRSYLLIDQSKSMNFTSTDITKLEYAQILGAALAYLMLKQQDAVGLSLFDSEIRAYIPPRSKSSHLNILLNQMSKINPGPETDIAPILHRTAETINKRGLIILISDLFDDPDEIISGIKHFRHKGHEVVIFHILDPQELTLDFSERTLFRDMETGEEIITEPIHIKKDYQRNMESFCDYYSDQCRKNRIDYIKLLTNQPLDLALTEYLIKRRRIGG